MDRQTDAQPIIAETCFSIADTRKNGNGTSYKVGDFHEHKFLCCVYVFQFC